MGKKVLIISSSPRRGGNSDLLCDRFLLGATEAGHTAEKIFLKDKNIYYCSGCGYCTLNYGNGCAQKDDIQELGSKMIESDVIVLATPVYFYSMSAQLKTFIDRMCAYYMDMKKKEIYFIVTAADKNKANMKRTLESLRGFTEDCLEDAKEKGVVYGLGSWNAGEIKDTPAFKEAYEMGKRV